MKRAAVIGFLAAMAVVHAIVAAWTPVQAGDWGHLVWAHSHDGAFITAHYQFSDLVGFVLARWTAFHIAVSPVVSCALVVGVFVLAFGRCPRGSWDDAFALALSSAALWIAGPRAGVVWFHRSYVAADVYGVTAALWLVAPLRCGWRVRPALYPVIALGGYCVGTSTRTIATAVLVGAVLALRGKSRDAWHRVLVGALVVGAAVGYASPPWIELARVFKRGLALNLGLINFPIREGGELTGLVLALLLVDRALAAVERPHAPDDARPDVSHVWRWYLGWFAIAVWSLFGPGYSEATLLPATVALVVAALPTLMWIARGRYLRYLLIAFAVGVHAVAWTLALRAYHQLDGEGRTRLAILERAAPGSIAIVPPYSQVLPTFFVFGEDLGAAGSRQLIANQIFGLRDISVVPAFRKYEPNPQIETALEVEGATDAQLREASPPALWATEPDTARYEFRLFAERLRAIVPAARAGLRVTNVAFDRPLVLAEIANGKIVAPTVLRSASRATDHYAFMIRGGDRDRFDRAWLVTGGTRVPVSYKAGRLTIQPLDSTLEVLVVCGTDMCMVADAFIPQL